MLELFERRGQRCAISVSAHCVIDRPRIASTASWGERPCTILRTIIECSNCGGSPNIGVFSISVREIVACIRVGRASTRSGIANGNPVTKCIVLRFEDISILEIDPGSCENTTVWNIFSGLIKKVKKTG